MASKRVTLQQESSETKAEHGRLLGKIPGRIRSRRELLAEVEEHVAERRKNLDSVLWGILLPDPRKLYVWKVVLACGHVTEFLTHGSDRFPDDAPHRDHVTQTDLNPGEMLCRDDAHTHSPRPYRDIVEWVSSEVKDFPADPVEPPDYFDAETWAKLRHDEPHSSRFWRVCLACGHHHDHVVTDLDWKPEDGPKFVTQQRANAMLAELEEYWADPDAPPKDELEREHELKMCRLRRPRPEPEQQCWTCPQAFQITGYQRVGPLVPPPEPPKPPKSDRELLEERLARAEAEASHLRSRLENLD